MTSQQSSSVFSEHIIVRCRCARVCVRVEEGFARGTRDRFGEDGFLLLAPGPQNMESGAPSPTAIGNFTPRLWD